MRPLLAWFISLDSTFKKALEAVTKAEALFSNCWGLTGIAGHKQTNPWLAIAHWSLINVGTGKNDVWNLIMYMSGLFLQHKIHITVVYA